MWSFAPHCHAASLAQQSREQHKVDHPGNAQHRKGQTPAEPLSHPAAAEAAQHNADVNAAVMNAGGQCARPVPVIVGNHRQGRGNVARLADPHQAPSEQKFREAARVTGGPGDQAPYHQADEDYARPPVAGPPNIPPRGSANRRPKGTPC